MIDKTGTAETTTAVFQSHRVEKRHLNYATQRYLHVLGPMPKRTLEMLVDLGLTDAEIASYQKLPDHVVTELRQLWDITPSD